jgi:hypothetical protein
MAGRVGQVVDYLPSKLKALSSNLNTTLKKNVDGVWKWRE